MFERGELTQVPSGDGRTYVAKSELVALKEARERAAKRPHTSEAREAAAHLREVVDRLTGIVDAQQRQLTVAQDDARQAVVQAARLEEQLKARNERIAELEGRLAGAAHRRRSSASTATNPATAVASRPRAHQRTTSG